MQEDQSAVVFPGQGTQRTGMGKDFFDNEESASRTYAEASDVLGWDVADMCFQDTENLHLTRYAQPCILTTEIAMFRTLQARFGLAPAFFGGHSLGEYAALAAAGVIPFPDALRLVEARGRLMQHASPVGTGAMAAVISDGLTLDRIRESLADLPVDIANVNSGRQIVLSGRSDCMDLAHKRVRSTLPEDAAMRFVPLNVSAPFHSRFMNGILHVFAGLLSRVIHNVNAVPAGQVTSNVTGGFHVGDPAEILNRLALQISGTVLWRENMKQLSARASRIIEVGPNRPLRNFFASMGVACSSITSWASALRTFK